MWMINKLWLLISLHEDGAMNIFGIKYENVN